MGSGLILTGLGKARLGVARLGMARQGKDKFLFMTAYYWNNERLEILRSILAKAENWHEAFLLCKHCDIRVNSFHTLATVAYANNIKCSNMKMGGYRRGILRTPEVIEIVRQVILKAESWQDVADLCYDKGLKAKYWVFRQIAYEYSLPHPNIKHGGNGFFT